jgi:hypothetical protein
MAKQLKCNSCGGTYPHPESTALSYVHVCPRQIVDTPEVIDPVTHEIITPVKFKPTPNPRDERLKANPEKPGEYVMTSEGSGVTEVE